MSTTPRPVLIGFAEALAGPESAWSLVTAGWPVLAFCRRGARPAVRLDGRVELIEVTPPEQDADACLAEVAALGRADRVSAVLPMDDAALWVCARLAGSAEYDGHGELAPMAGAAGEQAEFALDKRLQLDGARAAGLAVPPTFQSGDDVDDASFPMVVKPLLAASLEGNRLVRGSSVDCVDRHELATALTESVPGGPRVAQHRLEGVGEGLFCVVGDGRARAWSAHRRVRMMNPAGSGASACQAIAVDPELAEAAEKLLASVGWRGIAMVELLRDASGTAWFMEVNGRTWGSTALARRQGLEYPAWAVAEALGQPWETPAVFVDGTAGQPPDFVCRHAGREIVHLLAALRGPGGRSAPWPSRRQALSDVLRVRRSDRWYNAERRRVLFDDTVRTVMSQIRHRGGR